MYELRVAGKTGHQSIYHYNHEHRAWTVDRRTSSFRVGAYKMKQIGHLVDNEGEENLRERNNKNCERVGTRWVEDQMCGSFQTEP